MQALEWADRNCRNVFLCDYCRKNRVGFGPKEKKRFRKLSGFEFDRSRVEVVCDSCYELKRHKEGPWLN